MPNLNRVQLMGNLTRDPEIRYVNSGAAVVKFTLAINYKTQQKEEVTFIDCVAWEKLAETINTYCKKGKPLFVEGRLVIRSYETKEGEKRKATEVVVSSMQLLGSRDDAGSSASDGGGESVREFTPRGRSQDDEDEIPF